MLNWSETEPKYKLLIVALALVIAGAAAWFTLVRPIEETNKRDRLALAGKRAEVAQLRPYQARILQLTRELESLQQQVELQRKIVPEDKQVDSFIRGMQTEARSAGIEVRRYTVLPVVTREFYAEAPVELELDGPYFGVMQFYERVAKMERLVNISGLQMATIRAPNQAKAKKVYQYAPKETVAATCIATVFFNPPLPPPPPPGQKPGPGAQAPAGQPPAGQPPNVQTPPKK